MKPSIIEGRTLTVRTVVFVLASIALMVVDRRLDYLGTVRTHLLALVYPIQYLVNLPVKAGQWLSMSATSRINLLEENAQLREENLHLQVTLQKFQDLKSENERLRRLLGASVRVGERVQVAEVLAVELGPSRRKILIDKGKNHGVFIDQPVIDAQGVMGLVVHVGPVSSTVMLITDPDHELPVQVIRTGLRTVAKGMGTVNRLSLLYLSNIGLNTGIKVGDLIVTSGVGGKFPKSYPVGTVIEVIPDIGKPYAQVHALPRAALERNREVLLVWKSVVSEQLSVNSEQ
ncbi:MAG: rod shape-determining protein MreC [Candidatus Parabeggiatoa sp. nov. 2]|nr:MAG: rod shape-determining protein MreC [Beggiatoa sp. 4572_84]RKZ63258.1 MAG: rod shape-determining protein MreC [Gammaproteobacteria bacterium]HEC85530.1 rod shape-determining protein MreC [Thioploca sp.]